MADSATRTKRASRFPNANRITLRTFAGLMGLLPILSIGLARLVDSAAAGFVIAGTICITVVAILPHEDVNERRFGKAR